ncbi:MAG: ProQ/FINO family protein [Burkholderiaceae bacterium]|nr:ProQ/FINO family protein [Burkholderiaceae bacterium]
MSDTASHPADLQPTAAPAQPPQTAPSDASPPATQSAERTDRPAPRGRNNNGNRHGARGRGKQGQAPQSPQPPKGPSHPVLKQLAELEPTLFGANALPLKRGIFHDLMAAHPDAFEKDALKTALGLYTRSTRYLLAMASGQARHNLAGEAVEAVAPEHRYHSLLETFRRRHARTGEDVRQQVYTHILKAAEDSALPPGDYAALVRGKDEAANDILDAAMAELGSRLAREQALLRAFEASGQSVNAFADAYGLHPIEAAATLQRAQARVQAMAAAAAQAEAKAKADAEAEAEADPAVTNGNEPEQTGPSTV